MRRPGVMLLGTFWSFLGPEAFRGWRWVDPGLATGLVGG